VATYTAALEETSSIVED